MKTENKFNFRSLFILPMCIVWLETLNALCTKLESFMFLPMLIISFAFGMFLNCILMLIKNPKVSRIAAMVLVEVLTLFYLIEYFSNDSYSAYMSIPTILSAAGGVATEFGGAVIDVIKYNIPTIILMELPFIKFLIHKERFTLCQDRGVMPALCIFVAFCFLQSISAGTLYATDLSSAKATYDFNFNEGVRNFGVAHSVRLDTEYLIKGTPEAPIVAEEVEEPEVEVVHYYPRVVYDFSKLQKETDNKNIQSAMKLAASKPITYKNQYTGLFEGKNLIYICAESFSGHMIDKDRTPALYRLINNGIHFNEFYQPLWGASTTSGEASLLLGLIPTNGARTMQDTIGRDNSYTIGNKLKDLGYTSIAYHNGTHDYYNRINTHPGLGYSEYIAKGSGMEGHITECWPGSDLEMFQWTVDQFLDKAPFNIYYMSISGHGLYNFTGNQVAKWYKDKVSDLEGSDQYKGYIAANLDFEYALEYLLEKLEEKDLAKDTVIVIAADHFPYALQQGAAWNNTEDHVHELYGKYVETVADRDRNDLIIWSGCMEEEGFEPIEVSEPVYSVDLLPTLYNLFGIEYDSRIMVGRDALDTQPGLVVWPNGSWVTSKGFYNAGNGRFTPKDGEEIPENYVETTKLKASARINLSRNLQDADVFKFLNEH